MNRRKKMSINPPVAEEAPMSETNEIAPDLTEDLGDDFVLTEEMTDAEAIETLVRTEETHLSDDLDPRDVDPDTYVTDDGKEVTNLLETPKQVPVAGQTTEGKTVVPTQGAIGMFHVLSQIGDGVFVAWDRCHNGVSRHPISECKCKGGPTEPPYVTKWREEFITKRDKDTKKAIDALKKDARQEVGLEPLATTVDDGIETAKAAVRAAATEEVADGNA